MTFSKGDKVTVLDDAIDGIVISVNGNAIVIETTDGFELSFMAKELIKIGNEKLNFGISGQQIDDIIKQKEIPKARTFVKEKKTREQGIPEFDLHIEKLVKTFRHMNNFDILNIQTETAKRHIEFAIANRIPKIVFIHGVGEGVLKAELDFLLGRYDNIAFQDGNYQKYGLGATEVYIKQVK